MGERNSAAHQAVHSIFHLAEAVFHAIEHRAEGLGEVAKGAGNLIGARRLEMLGDAAGAAGQFLAVREMTIAMTHAVTALKNGDWNSYNDAVVEFGLAAANSRSAGIVGAFQAMVDSVQQTRREFGADAPNLNALLANGFNDAQNALTDSWLATVYPKYFDDMKSSEEIYGAEAEGTRSPPLLERANPGDFGRSSSEMVFEPDVVTRNWPNSATKFAPMIIEIPDRMTITAKESIDAQPYNTMNITAAESQAASSSTGTLSPDTLDLAEPGTDVTQTPEGLKFDPDIVTLPMQFDPDVVTLPGMTQLNNAQGPGGIGDQSQVQYGSENWGAGPAGPRAIDPYLSSIMDGSQYSMMNPPPLPSYKDVPDLGSMPDIVMLTGSDIPVSDATLTSFELQGGDMQQAFDGAFIDAGVSSLGDGISTLSLADFQDTSGGISTMGDITTLIGDVDIGPLVDLGSMAEIGPGSNYNGDNGLDANIPGVDLGFDNGSASAGSDGFGVNDVGYTGGGGSDVA